MQLKKEGDKYNAYIEKSDKIDGLYITTKEGRGFLIQSVETPYVISSDTNQAYILRNL